MGRRFQSYSLLLVAAVWLAMAACAHIPRVPLTAVAGKPKIVDSASAMLEEQSAKLATNASTIAQATTYVRERVAAEPSVQADVDPRLDVIDGAANQVAAIGTSQVELAAKLADAAKDLRAVIAERDAAIAQAKQDKKEADDAKAQAAAWEAKYRDDFRQTLIGWSVFITLAAVGVGALAGWLAFQGNISGAIVLGIVAAALFGSAALLVWFADHWRLVAIGSGVVVLAGGVYLIFGRVKLEQAIATLHAIVPAVEKMDPQGTTVKRDIEENALKAGVFPMVKHQISKIKQSVRLAGAA